MKNAQLFKGDSPEIIQRCLNCDRLECVDCIGEGDRPVMVYVQIDPHTWKIVNTFKSAREASNAVGIAGNGIRNCVKGIQQTAGGYVWEVRQL